MESANVTFLSDRFPVFWEEARGANVRDPDGNVLLDLTSAFGVALAGHAHPRIVDAVRRQAGRLVHGMGDVHPPSVKVDLLERLAALAPWPDTRITLASTGSEAVEIALKTALLATGRPGVISFEGAYHGLTLGALSATGRPFFRRPFDSRLYRGVGFAPWPDPMRQGPAGIDRCLREVESMLRLGVPVTSGSEGDAARDAPPDPTSGAAASGGPEGVDEDGLERVPVGAIILEPVQGRAGVRVPPEVFVQAVENLASAHGALLIADEVFTGIGRCGRTFASERLGFAPDIICLGKALGGGLPLSACMAPRSIMEAWPPSEGEALHTSTFLGHPLACASGLAMIELLLEGLAVQADRVGSKLFGMLRDVLDGVPGVGEVRGLGGMVGVELVDDDGEPLDGAGARVAEAALQKGLLVLPAGERGHVVQLTPPTVLTSEQCLFAVDTLHATIRIVLKNGRVGA